MHIECNVQKLCEIVLIYSNMPLNLIKENLLMIFMHDLDMRNDVRISFLGKNLN